MVAYCYSILHETIGDPDLVVVITITPIIAGCGELDSPTTGISIYVYKKADGKRSIMN